MSRYFWPCSMIKKHSKPQISPYSKKHRVYIFAKLQGREVSEDFHWGAGERVFNPNKKEIFEFCFFLGGGGQLDPLPPLLLSFNFIQLLKKQFRIGYIICYMLTSWVTFQQGKGKCQKIQKLLIIVNIGRENRHILWTTWAISMNFSGKMWLMTIKSHLSICPSYLSTASSNNASFIVL